MIVASTVGVPLQFLIQFKGLSLTTVSHASLMVSTLPILLALAAVFFLHEKLRLFEWGMLFLSTLGAALISVSKTSDGPQASVLRRLVDYPVYGCRGCSNLANQTFDGRI